ncbi:ABC transporter permease [Chitinophaga nivalis]|uniref:ABC transporter permease n=1 Tax=Chitinophaga nivalis TaxID=2991709 RepID=A0ABT3ITF4_9BACT|nr:ABC transporter permease [Chitinophaga nivalis]MCW3463048.1 ABC transporter permease [Chitinophaga nivalis]MCW3487262.1 ABC transporter permease [Chitinophaga nivalis]
MILNYFKIAFRNLRHNKAFTAINIFGLTLGMATCLIILLFISNEYSYDRFNKKAHQIVRVVFRGTVQGEAMKEANVMPPVAATLSAAFPEVEIATRLHDSGRPQVIAGNKTFSSNALAYVDPNFFQVFTLPFLQGDPATALKTPGSVVISRQMALKYFGHENPVGQLLHLYNRQNTVKVTGVMADIPAQSHFHFDILGSLTDMPEADNTSWMVSGYYTYLVLAPGTSYKKLEAKLPQIVEKHIGPQLLTAMGMSLASFRSKGNDIGLYLQPLTDIHLRSDLMFELESGGDIRYIYIFGAIAAFMLLIACINFMNLSTAGTSKRAREVGIRKVMGARKTSLVWQFLLESILLTSIALLLAIVLVQGVLPAFNNLAGKKLSLHISSHPLLLPGMVLFCLFTGVLAGSYPAFFLSSFRPIAVLKGKFTASGKHISLRSGLVVFQFFISVTLIISTTVVYKQLSYIRQKALGYNKEHLLILPEATALGSHAATFREQLLQDPRVAGVSISGYLPAGPSYYNNFNIYTDDHPDQVLKTLRYEVDDQYIPIMGMQLVAGRNFSREMATDSGAVIINETAAKTFGWGTNIAGHTLSSRNNEGVKTTYRVIGVVKDFHFKSLHERISPLVMTIGNQSGAVIVKTATTDITGLLTAIRQQWTTLQPEEPFYYSFMDDRFRHTYHTEEQTGHILGIFAALTILVACLGLLGLAMFTAAQRTKEISIRKLLGATITSIVALLSKDFLKLVLIANLIAWPLSWWIMEKWLQEFAYRIQISGWIFLCAGMLAVLTALFTISYQAIKAALSNPVNSLKAE